MTVTVPTQVQRSFPSSDRSVALARRWVRETLQAWGAEAVLHEAVLLTSELVTNAVMHAGTDVAVSCRQLDGHIRLEVADRYPSRSLPLVPSPPDPDREGGRGLFLSSAIATAWGVEYTRTLKRVWVRLDLPQHGGDPAAAPSDPLLAGADASLDVGSAVVGLVTTTRSEELAGLDVSGARLPLDELLQRTVEHARDALEGDAAFVVLGTDVEGEGEVRAVSGLPTARLRDVVPLDLKGRPGADAGAPRRLIDDAPPRVGRLLESAGVCSLVSVPLLIDGRAVGTLAVASRDSDRFEAGDVQRLGRIAERVALVVEGARLTELERQRRGWLAFLAEASDLLAGTLDRDMAMAIVAQLVVPRLATWCAVHLIDGTGEPRLGHVWHADETCIDGLRAILTLAEPPATGTSQGADAWDLGAALRGRQPPDGTAEVLADVVVTIPLLARGRALGSLVLGRGVDGFRREALDLAEDLARRAALALDNARLYGDIAAAGQALQRSLLPPELPVVPGLEVGVAYQAAGEGNEVGGDFYDLFGSSDGWWGFAVGDVCGKGAPAAAVTGLARHTLRALTRAGRPVAEALVRLNAALLEEGPDTRFVTVLFGVAQPQNTGGATLSFVSAGHPLPLVLRANGVVETAGSPQPLVGVMPDLDFIEDSVRLEPGDLLLAVTDGVTERRDGDRMLGDDGLAEVLRSCHGLAASAVAARIQQVVRDFAPEPPRDDMAVLVLQAH